MVVDWSSNSHTLPNARSMSKAIVGGLFLLTISMMLSTYPMALIPSQGKVDSRDLITKFHTSGDRIPPCGEPMV